MFIWRWLSYHYVDENNIFQECNETCYKCVNGGNEANATCIVCDTDLIKVEVEEREDYPSNCVANCPEGTYYYSEIDDDGNEINKLCKKCYRTCNKCSERGTSDTDQKCISCINNYYFKEDELNANGETETGNCFTGDQNGYYLLEDATGVPNGGVYKKCDNACEKCSNAKTTTSTTDSETGETTTTTSTNCIICNYNDNYYPVEEDPSNCLQPDTETVNTSPITNYYLYKGDDNDRSTYSWKKCYETCTYCSQGSTDYDEQYCIEFNCIEGTYPSYDKRTNCWKEEIKNRGYYLGLTDTTDTWYK